MEKILLSSRAFVNQAITESFLSLLGIIDYQHDQLVIITNSVREGKSHPKMIDLKTTLENIGFQNIILFDVFKNDPNLLKTAKAIILNGGYEFILLDSLRQTGSVALLKKLILNGKPVYGISAGAIVLGPDLDLFAKLYPEDNFNNDSDTASINATSIRIYPHYDKHLQDNPQLESSIKAFEKSTNSNITRLGNDEGIVIRDGVTTLISPAD